MTDKPDLTLYLGGTRSGKSAPAEAAALQARGPVLYGDTVEVRASGGIAPAAPPTGARSNALAAWRNPSPPRLLQPPLRPERPKQAASGRPSWWTA